MTAQEIYDAAQREYTIKPLNQAATVGPSHSIVNSQGAAVGALEDRGIGYEVYLYLDVDPHDDNPWEYLGRFERLVDVQMCVYCYFHTSRDYFEVLKEGKDAE